MAPAECAVDRLALEASLVRESYYDFVQRFWGTVVQADPVWNWHIKVLCDELQACAERVFLGLPREHDLVVNVPPGSTKSLIFTVFFTPWVWTRMPEARILCTSYARALATDLSLKSRDVVLSPKYRRLFPEIALRADKNTKSHFANTLGGERFCSSTGGMATGMHSHFVMIDDPLNPEQAVSEPELRTANRYVGSTLTTRKVDKKVTLTALIMQRLHQNDPTAMKLEEADHGGAEVRHICLPGEIDDQTRDQVRPRKLAVHYTEDGLLDPVRFSRESLHELRVSLKEFGYAGQILQRPVPLGGGMFKVDRLEVDEPGPIRHFKRIVRYWDKAGTQDAGAWTVGALMGEDARGRFWVLDIVRGQWESARRENVILQTARADDTLGAPVLWIGVEQEPGSGGKDSAQGTVRNLAGFTVKVDRPTGDKVIRADPFSVQVNAHNVMLKAGEWNREYVDEMQHFPYSRYKDQVDASSGAFKLLTEKRRRSGGLW